MSLLQTLLMHRKPNALRLLAFITISLTTSLTMSIATCRHAYSQQGFESKIADLIRATDEARDRISASAEQQTRDQTPSSTATSAAQPDPSSRNTSLDATEIRKRLQLLRRMRLDRPQQAPPEKAPPMPTFTESSLSPLVPQPTPVDPSEMPGLVAIESNIAPERSTAPSITDNPPIIQSQQILESAVDLLQLGQSLYQTKNYAAAINSFEAIDETKLSLSDQSWLELMTALCRRKLGKSEKAQAALRDLANSDGIDYTVPLAKWWLAHSETTDTAISKLQDLENQLSPLKQRLEAHVKP